MNPTKEAIDSAMELLSQHYDNAEETTTKQVIELTIDRLNIALKSLEGAV